MKIQINSKNKSPNIIIKELITFLSTNKKKISPLLILTHDFPDPDALASAYALQYLADKAFGIHSRIVYRGIIGRIENRNMVNILELPVHQLRPWDIKKYSHIALVDTQPNFENNPFPGERKATIVIDQHSSHKNKNSLADLLIIDTTCGATCVILAQVILSLKLPIPERLATALAYGISSDTSNLHRASRPDIIQTYLKILSFANMRTLARIQIPLYDKEYFSILGKGIRVARFSQGLILCHLGTVSSPDVVSQMADFLLSYKHTKWTLTTGRFKNKLHVSLRTIRVEFSAAQLLRKCFADPKDAGGHGRIAGGSLKILPNSNRKFKKEELLLEGNIIKHLSLKKPKKFYRLFN
jgi:nanoRNase/pAp phosphatase (c-di-AMP/oligoRNAs hydrolase)